MSGRRIGAKRALALVAAITSVIAVELVCEAARPAIADAPSPLPVLTRAPYLEAPQLGVGAPVGPLPARPLVSDPAGAGEPLAWWSWPVGCLDRRVMFVPATALPQPYCADHAPGQALTVTGPAAGGTKPPHEASSRQTPFAAGGRTRRVVADWVAEAAGAVAVLWSTIVAASRNTRQAPISWYLPLRVSPRLILGAASSVDAFAVLLHYGGGDPASGIALLPGELFGHRDHTGGFTLRGTLAAGEAELHRFTSRLGQACAVLSGPDGTRVIHAALRRARTVADLDAILENCRY